MNIGLIGAPGSGKTVLAKAITDKLEATHHYTEIVDDYVSAIEKETNLSITQVCDYLGNLYVALGRYARERNARERYEHVITCGTFLDTSVYTALDISAQAAILSDQRKAEEAPKVQATIMMMAALYTDIFQYDHVFYLPYSSSEYHYQQFDQFVQAAIAAFKLTDAVMLTDPDLDTRLKKVLETVS